MAKSQPVTYSDQVLQGKCLLTAHSDQANSELQLTNPAVSGSHLLPSAGLLGTALSTSTGSGHTLIHEAFPQVCCAKLNLSQVCLLSTHPQEL